MHWLSSHLLTVLAYGYEVLGGILIFYSSAVTETSMTSLVDFPSAASLILHPKFPAKQLASKILTLVHGIAWHRPPGFPKNDHPSSGVRDVRAKQPVRPQ